MTRDAVGQGRGGGGEPLSLKGLAAQVPWRIFPRAKAGGQSARLVCLVRVRRLAQAASNGPRSRAMCTTRRDPVARIGWLGACGEVG